MFSKMGFRTFLRFWPRGNRRVFYEYIGNSTRSARQMLWSAAKVLGVLHLATTYVGNVTLCIGPSMIPTFKTNGDLVYVDMFSSKILNRGFKKGDVVIAICPYDADKTVCKRIAALPGEVVCVRHEGHDGYFSQTYNVVPQGHVWLLGDNAANSTDSRKYGSVPIGLIQGRVLLKLSFPPMLVRAVEPSSIHEYLASDSEIH